MPRYIFSGRQSEVVLARHTDEVAGARLARFTVCGVVWQLEPLNSPLVPFTNDEGQVPLATCHRLWMSPAALQERVDLRGIAVKE